jgi:hypothetical protein
LIGRLLGGYNLNLIYQYNSGQPYNPIQNFTTVQSTAITGILCAAYSADGKCQVMTPAQTQAYTQATTSFCDFGFASVDGNPCRPVLSNPSAPLGSVGINLGSLGYYDYVSGNPTTPSAEHWTWNNQVEAIALHNPFPGVGRNILRGDTWNDIDMTAGKTFHVAERVNVQTMVTVFNLFNRAYYANPDFLVEDSLTGAFGTQLFTGTTLGSGAGNGSFPQGLGNRNVQLQGKITF